MNELTKSTSAFTIHVPLHISVEFVQLHTNGIVMDDLEAPCIANDDAVKMGERVVKRKKFSPEVW